MAKDKYHIESLTPELIKKYHQGKLSEGEQYAVEKLMLNSEFEADAMEGYAQESQLVHDLATLNKRLDARISEEKKSTLSFWLKIAASIIILTISTYLIFDTSPDQTLNDKYISKGNEPANENITEIELPTEEVIEETTKELPQELKTSMEIPKFYWL